LRRSEKCTRPGGWDFPGGGLDFGEDPTQGIVREVTEETALQISNPKPIHAASAINDRGEFAIMIGYTAKAMSADLHLSWEHDEYLWLNRDEALKIELPEIHKKILEKALATL
jgi:8-oxo-dGTP diphosphatase